ncbi:MAG TPA: LptA/OstA family protein [Chthoniobacterales bacterium]|nr:LptA/OstA family protein [Chthoniobacterales bacterium]
MTKLAVAYAILFALLVGVARGQGSAPATLSRTPSQPSDKASPAKIPSDRPPSESDPARKSEEAKKPAAAQEQIITEIYADKTVFDSAKSIGIFTGHIVVTDPRFSIQGDKLTIYLGKKQNEGFEKAVVEGNVGVVRDRPNTGGGPPDRMVGRSEKAVYTAKDGRFELTGNPRVQQGLNTHVATSPDTVMILNEAGQLETHGPSRTEIRQEPNAEKTPPKP